jgi:hypothetical protein
MSIFYAIPSADNYQTNLTLKILLDNPLIIDFSNNKLKPTYYGDVRFSPNLTLFNPSIYQGSFYFGTSVGGLGFISSSISSLGSQDFCIEAWVKVNSTSNNFNCIVSTIDNVNHSAPGGGALAAGVGGWGGESDSNYNSPFQPGNAGIFGQGGDGAYGGSYRAGGGGGGGGYYGGGGGGTCIPYYNGHSAGGGGGGSNFISNSFSDTISKKGSETIILPNGTSSTGNPGNGYARITRSSDNSVTNFSFTGFQQTFTVPADDNYIIEVWGAQGGNATSGGITEGGRGGYCKGTIFLTAGTILYVYVGGQNGYNGGGAGGVAIGTESGAPGGGASDVRLGGNTLFDRIIVAGGGGGCGGRGPYGGITQGIGGAAGENGKGASPDGITLAIDTVAKGFWAYVKYTDGSYDFIREDTDPLDTTVWNHVALTRYGSTISLYRNGTKTGEINCGTKSIKTNTSGRFYIGCFRDEAYYGTLSSLKGNLNDVRITIGNARYTSNFTPPSAFGTSIHTIDLSIGDTITFTAPYQNFNPYQELFDQKFKLTFIAPYQNFNPYQEPFSQKFVTFRTDETWTSPKNPGVVTGLPKDTSGSQHFAGWGKIYGVVTENAQPISCMLRLYDYVSGALVAVTHSAPDGSYQFGNLDMTRIYTLVAYDPNKNYNSIIRDLIKPERM